MTSSDHLICLDSEGTARNLRVPVDIGVWWERLGVVSSNVWAPVPSVVAIAVLAMVDKVLLLVEQSEKRYVMNSLNLCACLALWVPAGG